MPNYRRHRTLGGTYFFTVNLLWRKSTLLTTQIDLLRASVHAVRQAHPFHIDAWVVLPEHMHCLWTLPIDDGNYAVRWRLIKTRFSLHLPKTEVVSPSRKRRGERAIWQRRYWEHAIRDDRDYAAHMDYVYINPLKHGLVYSVRDWPYSSFHRDVALGLYPLDWACEVPHIEAGE